MTPLEIDLATIRTWPAALTENRNGWFCLAAGGVTGRVNAAWPLSWTGGDLDAAISDVEAWYSARNLAARFKLTDGAFAPACLPERLSARGYGPVAATLIMTAPVTAREAPQDVRLSSTMPAEFDAALKAASRDAAEYDERQSIALRAPQPAAFATIEREGAIVAIGMSAAAGDLAGIFLMRTAPEARRQGLARRTLDALMAQHAGWGARTAFLQVEAGNTQAIALYQRAGFTTLSTYRFWRKLG